MSTCQCCSIQSDCEKLLRTSVLPYMATFAVLVSVTSTLSVQWEGWAIPRSNNYLRSHQWQSRHMCMYVHSGNLLQCQYLWMDSTSSWLHRWPHALALQTHNMPYCYKWPHTSLLQMTTLASPAHKVPHGLCRVAKDHSYTWHHGSGNIHSLLPHHNIHSEQLVLKKLLLCAYTNTTHRWNSLASTNEIAMVMFYSAPPGPAAIVRCKQLEHLVHSCYGRTTTFLPTVW